MKSKILLWIIAFIVTIVIAAYQRITGPTYPVSGHLTIQGKEISYKFPRSHGGAGDQIIQINTGSNRITGQIVFRRLNSNDKWMPVKMKGENGILTAIIPHQPPAGKVQYYVVLNNKNEFRIPQKGYTVIRFHGTIPLYILIPHVLFMFSAMLFSTRTGLEFFTEKPKYRNFTYVTLVLLFVGGLILGPIVQKFAFGAFWTGFPFGHDLTDNKTIIAFVGWLIALFMYKKSHKPGIWAIGASIFLLIVYLIPHSALGSELNYHKIKENNKKTERVINIK
jgi:hypothetical protein